EPAVERLPIERAWEERIIPDLERALAYKAGHLFEPGLLWSRPGDRMALLRAMRAESEGEARRLIADWLRGLGYEWRATAFENRPLLLVVSMLGDRDRPLTGTDLGVRDL